ncbi:MAG TPA: DUF4912 domain-containing protein [Firmicutes bacterium]|uniref:DUF4912 domain-containing protein n=1 Tax=Capillibacterium thermochitinicola TaxID=2699427 RepID=A0A8J6HZX3_9FIRM|nr:DUF4912 domain-containing protein [Capillibacterium thermochitinicola]MBA2132413.1 DUF4912 domain-containing protein [Capillibacterium thermochitinicola]HHW12045.1 DUF4912 domain-containing protein [Bacillota bacterium]
MTREELAKKTREELLSLARKLKIKNRSRMKKDELIESLNLVFKQNQTTAEAHAKAAAEKKTPEPVYTTGLSPQTYPPPPGEEPRFPLPSSYNETSITLLIRDPFWLYTYWDFSREVKENLEKMFGDWQRTPLSLRVWEEQESGGMEPGFFNVPVNPVTGHWYLNVQPNRRYTVELGYIAPSGEFVALARSNTVVTPRATVSEVIDEEWMLVEEDFRRLYQLAGDPQAGSVELAESLLKRLEREMGSGAVSSISSPFGPPPEERQFWLVLNTELILYGATEPSASLTVDGQPVPLRPDGTFTLRMALPDGRKRIPVTARSQDGKDAITIIPEVTKETY